MKNLSDNNLILDTLKEEGSNPLKFTKVKDISNDSRPKINSGFGACNACDCRGYKANDPKNDYCRACGHHWERHS